MATCKVSYSRRVRPINNKLSLRYSVKALNYNAMKS